ncbi:MAG: Gfo/Idh/MocA family protein [Opitutales bacterium]
MSQLRFGIVGAGMIAKSGANSFNSHPDAAFVAAHDLNRERLEQLGREFEVDRLHDTAEALFADDQVDGVYIAVPNKFHAPLAIQALEAGKHVILEKPFAMNAVEAEAVIAAADKAGRKFALGMNQRFREDVQKLRTLVSQGVFGEVYHAKTRWMRRSGIPRLGTWFGNRALAGGGSINDIGVHALDLCLYILDNFEPVSVSGVTYTKFGNRGIGEGGWGLSDREEITFDVDDFASALIKFRNGATVVLDTAWACHQKDPNQMGCELYGTEAGGAIPGPLLFRADPLRADYDVIENVQADAAFPHGDRFHNFINHILDREPLAATPQQSLVIQRILDAVNESCRTGREVRLDG